MEISAKDWFSLLAMVQSLRRALEVQTAQTAMLIDSLHARGALDYEEVRAVQEGTEEFAHILLNDDVATERFGAPRAVLQESGVTLHPPPLLGKHLEEAFETLFDEASLRMGNWIDT